MRRFVLMLIISLLLVLPAYAGDTYTLPADLSYITPDNAAQITQLAAIGGRLTGDLVWSADGKHLAVGTSQDVQVFNVQKPEQPPILISGGGDAAFEGEKLVYDGQFWDTSTGKSLGVVPAAASAPKYSPSGDIEVLLNESSLQLKHRDGRMVKIKIDAGYPYRDIVFSPDEHYAALVLEHTSDWGSVLPVVQLWNIETGKFINNLPQVLEIKDTVAFHADGALLVTATTTNAQYGGPFEDIKIWDGRTGQPVPLPQGVYLPLRFSPDGRFLALLTGEGVSLWTDHELGILKFDDYADFDSTYMMFSPDSRTLATPNNERILLWDVSGSQAPTAPIKTLKTESGISGLLFSPDGSLLVSGENSKNAEIWNMKTRTLQARLQASDFIYTMTFSPDGSLLRGEEFGGSSLIWDTTTGEKRLTLPRSALLNNDWSKAAYWGVEGSVHVADTASGAITDIYQIDPYLGKTDSLNATTGRALFIGADIRGYDLENGDLFFQRPLNGSYPWTQFNTNGSHFLTGTTPTIYGRGDPAVIDVWDSANLDQPVTTVKIPEGGGNRYMLLSPDGRVLSQLNTACGDGGGGSFQLWDAHSGEPIFRLNEGACGPYEHIFTPDGKYLLVSWDSAIVVIDVDAAIANPPTEIGSLAATTSDTVLSYLMNTRQITLSPDGTRLAVSVAGYHPDNGEPPPEPWVDVVKLSDVLNPGFYTDMPIDTTVRISNATQATFSPDNAFVLTEKGLYDAKTGTLLASIASTSATFSADSKTLVTVDKAGFQLWDVAALAKGATKPLAAFAEEGIQEAAFNTDGTNLYIRRVGDVQVWGIAQN